MISYSAFVVNMSCIPLHGHNIGSGPLNIEGNSIRVSQMAPCCGGVSSHSNLTTDQVLLGSAALTVLLEVRASAPSSWGPW